MKLGPMERRSLLIHLSCRIFEEAMSSSSVLIVSPPDIIDRTDIFLDALDKRLERDEKDLLSHMSQQFHEQQARKALEEERDKHGAAAR